MSEVASTAPGPGLVRRAHVAAHAALFVLGFSVIFVVGWGGAATLLGQLFGSSKAVLGKIGGLVVIVFGLSTLGVVRIPWLNYDTRPQWKAGQKGGLAASALMGMFFAAGWTPCIGTTLGAILTLGMSQQTTAQAMLLASGYAFGLGVPFLAIGLGVDRAMAVVRRLSPHLRKMQIASGLLLVGLGLLLFTDRIILIAIWAQRNRLFLDLPLGGFAAPNYLIAVLAGLISFLSPCVLPLVPAYVGYLSGHALRAGGSSGGA